MTKALSFYQYLRTIKDGTGSKAQFAEAALDDHMFPKYESEFDALSTYLENYGTQHMRLETFDMLFDDYQEWLKF